MIAPTVEDAAYRYAQLGLHVIPVGADKRPTIEAWQTSGTVDPTQIYRWRKRGELVNVGVVMGLSRLIAVDMDVRNGGAETFSQLEAELGPLPPTPTADTGGGGTHHVFRAPLDTSALVGKLGPGVDLLHGGRQIVVEPSIHPSGGIYRWRPELAPGEIEFAELPPAWIERATRKAHEPRTTTHAVSDDARVKRARAYLAKIPGAVSGDSGHDHTFKTVAHMLVGFDLAESDARALIDEWNVTCDPPWSERELDHKFKSAAASRELQRGYLLGDRPAEGIEPAAPNALDGNDSALLSQLLRKKDRTLVNCGANVDLLLRGRAEFRGHIRFNELTKEVEISGGPFHGEGPSTLDTSIENWLMVGFGLRVSRADVGAQLARVARMYGSYDPIAEYLRSLSWDGVARIDRVLSMYCHVDDTPYTRMIGARFLISAAARGLNPGCKVDTVLILHGGQGLYKSAFFDVLGGEWFSDSPLDLRSKDARLEASSRWIIEIAEVSQLGSDSDKAFIAARKDYVRAPYARVSEEFLRHCVFGGSTNGDEFLIDETGNRRFWVAKVRGTVELDALRRDRDQLWAEAAHRYWAGERWWLDRNEQLEADRCAREFSESDAWAETIKDWWCGLAAAAQREHASVGLSLAEVAAAALRLDIDKLKPHEKAIGRALRRAGFEKRGTSKRRWYPKHDHAGQA